MHFYSLCQHYSVVNFWCVCVCIFKFLIFFNLEHSFYKWVQLTSSQVLIGQSYLFNSHLFVFPPWPNDMKWQVIGTVMRHKAHSKVFNRRFLGIWIGKKVGKLISTVCFFSSSQRIKQQSHTSLAALKEFYKSFCLIFFSNTNKILPSSLH